MRIAPLLVVLLASFSMADAAKPSAKVSQRSFDRGQIDDGCISARSAYGAPHHVKTAAQLRDLLDRCAYELSARENTKNAYAAYLGGAPERSNWAPLAQRGLCGLDPAWPGCADGGLPVIAQPSTPRMPVQQPADPNLPSVSERLVTGQRHENDAALVIGLEDYPFASDVPHARRDAQAFADFLRYTRGVPDDRIVVITKGSVETMREGADRVSRMTGAGGTLWVFFAGHGAAHPVSRARLLLGDDLRTDAGSLISRGVPVEELVGAATGRAAHVVSVLDTCFAGTGRDGSELVPGGRFAIPTYAVRTSNVIEWAATGPGEIAVPLPGANHGAFTYFVLGALRGWADGEIDGKRDGKVTVEEANVFVRRALRSKGLVDMTPSLTTPDNLKSWPLASVAPEKGPSL